MLGKANPLGALAGVAKMIKVDELAASMVDIVLNGSQTEIVVNDVIRSKARELLSRASS